MRHLWIALLLTAVASGQIALQTHTITTTGSTTTGINTVGATAIAVGCANSSNAGNGATTSLTSSPSTSWNFAVSGGNPTSGWISILYALAPTTSSSQTFTCGNYGVPVTVTTWTGTATTSATDGTSNSLNTSGDTCAPGSITPTVAGDVFVTAYGSGNGGGATPSISGSFTMTDHGTNSSYFIDSAMAYIIDSTTAAESPTWTNTNDSTAMACAMVAFKAGTQAASPTCAPGTENFSGSVAPICTNPNTGTTVQCYSESTTPATNGAGTACATGTALTSGTALPSITSTTTVQIIAGTSTLSDSPVNTYVYTLTAAHARSHARIF